MSKEIDREVVESLYRKYWFQVYSRCRSILGNEEEARDAAQEVFVSLISKGGSFRGGSNWMTWLYRVATNICFNRLKKTKLRDNNWQEAVKLNSTKNNHEDLDTALTWRTTFRRALMRCDTKTQQIAVHHVWDEMTQQEIGDLLGISRVTVNKKLSLFRNIFSRLDEEAKEK